jgi:glycosyltransferase involved in cell wall biosynthesis
VTQSLRVLHVNDQAASGGGENQTRLLIRELEALGVENHLLHVRGAWLKAQLADLLPAERFHSLPAFPPALSLPFVTRMLVRRLKPDLVHAHTGKSTLGFSWLPADATCVMHRRIPEALSSRALARARRANGVIAISRAIFHQLEEQGLNANRLHLIHSSVELLDCDAGPLSECDGPVFAYLGYFRRHKGLDLLLDALALLDPDKLKLTVLLIGEGPEEQALKSQAARLNLGERVRFLPFQPEPCPWLKAVDLLLLPSRSEGLGSVALQAQSLGTPVLGCRAGGIPEAVIHDLSGWLVPPEDPQALAEALRLLATDQALRQRLAAAGPAHIAANFTAKRMAEKTIELYRWLIV